MNMCEFVHFTCLFMSLFSANRDCAKCVPAQHCVHQRAENQWKRCHSDSSGLASHPENP